MKMQISELAKAAGVSVRTLQYYDKIGLLPPAKIQENGYRVYDESSLEQLERILYYKQMDFPLKAISQLIRSENSPADSLFSQRKSLLEKRCSLDMMIENIEKSMSEPVPLEPWFDKMLREYSYSGFSYFGEENESFYAWGKADYENDIGFTPISRFPIGGITQQFTAICVLMLCDEGRLDLSSPLSDLLPEDEKRKECTVCELLNGAQSEDYFQIKRCYILLGNILERLCGKPLSEVFSEKLFVPLKMTRTSLGGSCSDVIGYDKYNEPIPFSTPENGADGIISTADDMAVFYEAILNGRLLQKPYDDILTKCSESFFGGFFRNGHKLFHTTDICGITADIELDMEAKKIYIGIRNKEPIPDKGDRLMYYPINCCDDGYVKFEVWTMDSGSEIKLTSIRIFEKNAEELYSVSSDEPLINIRNDGEQRHASDFSAEGYYYEINLAEILGNKFDRKTSYIAELRAECSSHTAAQLGCVYKKDGEWVSGYFNVFSQYISAYPLFMEALHTVTYNNSKA